jgi:hypothetical protein
MTRKAKVRQGDGEGGLQGKSEQKLNK